MAKHDPVQPFHTTFTTLILCGFVALIVTGVAYSVATVAIVAHLEKQYHADRTVLSDLLGQDTPNALPSSALNNPATWQAILTRLRDDGNLSTLSDESVKQLQSNLARDSRADAAADLSAVGLAIAIAQVAGNSRDVSMPALEKRHQYETLLAGLLAGVPGQLHATAMCTAEVEKNLATKHSVDSSGIPQCRDAIGSSNARRLWSGMRMQGLDWSPRKDIAQQMFKLTQAWADDSTSRFNGDVRRNAFHLTEALLQTVDTAGNVKKARMYFNIFVGPIQFTLYYFFVFLVVLLIARISKRRRLLATWLPIRAKIHDLRLNPDAGALATSLTQITQAKGAFFARSFEVIAAELHDIERQGKILRENDPTLIQARISNTANQLAERAIGHMCNSFANLTDNSRWLIRWLARSLPALGFLHTVLGIAFALVKADLLVRATSSAARAMAMLEVSSVLGVAFTTTFLALFAGLIASLMIDWEFSKEDAFLDDFETMLTVNINPIYTAQPQQDGRTHAA